jgi:hypothetical protein
MRSLGTAKALERQGGGGHDFSAAPDSTFLFPYIAAAMNRCATSH